MFKPLVRLVAHMGVLAHSTAASHGTTGAPVSVSSLTASIVNRHVLSVSIGTSGLGHDWDGSVVKDSTSTSPSSGVEVSSHSPGTPEMF